MTDLLAPTSTRHPRRSGTPRPAAAAPWLAFAALAVGQLLVDVDDAVLNVALPTISAEMHLSLGLLPWVVNAYVLCFGGLLLLGGRLADRYGHRRVLLAGVAVFVLASLAGAAASGPAALLAARAGQGLAAALLAPAAMSLLVTSFPDPADRARALGLWGAVTGAGALVGLLVGGLVTETLGWRWLFVGNAGLALVVGVSVRRLLPVAHAAVRERIEPWGAMVSTAALVGGVHLLDQVRAHGWAAPGTLAEGAVVGSLVALAVLAHRRAIHPFVPRALLRDRSVVVSDGCAALAGAALLATFFVLSLHLQQGLHYTPLHTAFAYLPMIGALALAAGAASEAVGRVGVRPVLAAGMGISAVGLAVLGVLAVDVHVSSYASSVLPGLLVAGCGLGLVFVSLTVSAVPGGEGAPGSGAASGLYNTALQVGGALGVAVLATVAHTRSDALVARGVAAAEAVADGRSLALLTGSGILAAAVLLAMAMPAGTGRVGATDTTGVA